MPTLTLPSLLDDATRGAVLRERMAATAGETDDADIRCEKALQSLTGVCNDLLGIELSALDTTSEYLDPAARAATDAQLLLDAAGHPSCAPVVRWYAEERVAESRAEAKLEHAESLLRAALPRVTFSSCDVADRFGLPPEQARVRVVRALTPEPEHLTEEDAGRLASWVGQWFRRFSGLASEGLLKAASTTALRDADHAHRLIAEDDYEVVRMRVGAEVVLAHAADPRLRDRVALAERLLHDELLHRLLELRPSLRSPRTGRYDTGSESLLQAFANRRLELSMGLCPPPSVPTTRYLRPGRPADRPDPSR